MMKYSNRQFKQILRIIGPISDRSDKVGFFLLKIKTLIKPFKPSLDSMIPEEIKDRIKFIDNQSMLNSIGEIFHPIRFKILNLLNNSPETFSSLSKTLQLSNSEVSRHLNKMYDQNLLTKMHQSRNIELTTFGKTILHLFQPIQLLLFYQEFFDKHIIHDLPDEILSKLHLLRDAELIIGSSPVMFKMAEISDRAQESMKMMINQPFPFGKPGLNMSYIVPPEMLKYKAQIQNINQATTGKILHTIQLSVTLTGFREGLLFFRNTENILDFEAGFYVSSPNQKAYEFLEYIWDYYWNLGENMKK